jgi:hypothetical protein
MPVPSATFLIPDAFATPDNWTDCASTLRHRPRCIESAWLAQEEEN